MGLRRGLRRPDAVCDLYLFDPRYKMVSGFVPEQFGAAWKGRIEEDDRRDVTLSEFDRSSYYRKLALQHYGCCCHACNFAPRVDSQIHVYHKNPRSEGERLTTVEDLIPMCANCHALGHSEVSPMEVEVLQRLARENENDK